ncbi:hypothetical protein COOONC_27723 [Cooperia oncophora]
MAVQVVEEVARSPMLPANFPKSPERVRVVSQSLQRPTAPVPPKQSAAGSWDQESGYDDVNLNEEDLVDINVDTFFSSTETLDSASGDETDTPSRNIRKKFREFLSEPGTSTPLSPKKMSRVGTVRQIVGRGKVRSGPESAPSTSSTIPSAQLRKKQARGAAVEQSARTAQRLSPQGSFVGAEQTAGSTHSLLVSSANVCNKVENMLGVMELSLQNNEPVLAPENVDATRTQIACDVDNLGTSQQFAQPSVPYSDGSAGEIVPLDRPLSVDELMQKIEAEFCDLTERRSRSRWIRFAVHEHIPTF